MDMLTRAGRRALFRPRPGRVQVAGVKTGIKRAELTATVIRADGSTKELGVVAASDFTFWGRVRSFLAAIASLFTRKGGADA